MPLKCFSEFTELDTTDTALDCGELGLYEKKSQFSFEAITLLW